MNKEEAIAFVTELLQMTNIHGHINHRLKSKRKPVVSRIGKKPADIMAKGIIAGLECVIKFEFDKS